MYELSANERCRCGDDFSDYCHSCPDHQQAAEKDFFGALGDYPCSAAGSVLFALCVQRVFSGWQKCADYGNGKKYASRHCFADCSGKTTGYCARPDSRCGVHHFCVGNPLVDRCAGLRPVLYLYLLEVPAGVPCILACGQ